MSQVENKTNKLKSKKSFLWISKKDDSSQTPCLKKKKSISNTLLSAPAGALKKKSSGIFTTVLGKINSHFSKNTSKTQDVNNLESKGQPRYRSTNSLRCSNDTSSKSKLNISSTDYAYTPITSSNIPNKSELDKWSNTLLDALDATQNRVNTEINLNPKTSNQNFMSTTQTDRLQNIFSNNSSNNNNNNNNNNNRNKKYDQQYRYTTGPYLNSNTYSKRKSDCQTSWRQQFDNISDLSLDEGLHQISSIQQDNFSTTSEYNYPSMTEATPRSTSEFNNDHFFKKEIIDNKTQSFENNKKSLLSDQIEHQNRDDMTFQEKLEKAAARRNLIKYNRQREQMDTALVETLEMLSNGQYTDMTSASKKNDMKVRDWIISCQQKDSEVSLNNLDATTSQDFRVW